MYEHEFRPLLFIFLLECAAFFCIWILFIIDHFFSIIKNRNDKKDRRAISDFLNAALKGDNPEPSECLQNRRLLILLLEAYTHKFDHEGWHKLKEELINKYLLKKAKRCAKSIFWKKRVFSARLFALLPRAEDEKELLFLVHDKKTMTQIYAAQTLVKIESEKGIKAVLEVAREQSGYQYYVFKDFFENSTERIFEILLECAKTPDLHKIALSILAPLVIPRTIPFLTDGLSSDDFKTKLLTLELLSNNPGKGAEDILIPFLEEKNERLQLEAIRGLGKLATEKGIEKLESVYSSTTNPRVQLEAARSLHYHGKLMDKPKTEITEYVLQFG